MKSVSIHFVCGKIEAKDAYHYCIQKYGQKVRSASDVVVVLGGDGSVLQEIHRQIKLGIDKPIFALNYGHRGQLANNHVLESLPQRIAVAMRQKIVPLRLMATLTPSGKRKIVYAINEFSVLRASPQAAQIKMIIQEKHQSKERVLFGDGCMIATPVGSSAYYSIVGGYPMAIDYQGLGIQSINTDRHISELHSNLTRIGITRFQGEKRPIMIEGDGKRYSHISRAVIEMAPNLSKTLLFDRQKAR